MGLREAMRHARRKTLLVPAVVLVVLAVPLAGCGSSGSASSPGTGASSSPAAAGGTASAATAAFVSIIEPFDPGHPARAGSAPDSCGGQSTAIEIERCYQAKTENVDAQINVAQSARYSSAAPAERNASCKSADAAAGNQHPISAPGHKGAASSRRCAWRQAFTPVVTIASTRR